MSKLSGLFGSSTRGRSATSRRATGVTNAIFVSALGLLVVMTLVIVFNKAWTDTSPGSLPTLSLQSALPPGPGNPANAPTGGAAAAIEWFTVQVAVYNGSENGLKLAYSAQAELIHRGLPEVTVIGHRAPDEADGFETYELIVGAARTSEALKAVLSRLWAINDWGGGKAAPFLDAHVVPHPSPEIIGG